MSEILCKAAVTGGSRGNRRRYCQAPGRRRSKRGHHLHQRRGRRRVVVKAIEGAGGKAIAIQADATDAEAVQAAVEKTVATFGRLDILVNNAGTAIPKPFEEATLEELDRIHRPQRPRRFRRDAGGAEAHERAAVASS